MITVLLRRGRLGLSPSARVLSGVLDREAGGHRVGFVGGGRPAQGVADDAERLKPGRSDSSLVRNPFIWNKVGWSDRLQSQEILPFSVS